jgi:nucleotide-binding universal stress UspA family protein
MSTGTGSERGGVVVGVDGSPSSVQALRWALGQARLTGAAVRAVTTWDFPASYGWAVSVDDVDWEGAARTVLERAVKEAAGADATVPVEQVVVRGHPAQVLVEVAAGADLLVVGSRGHGGFAGLLLGSVSQHVVAHASSPVVVVHDAPDPDAG